MIALCVLDGPINGESFLADVERFLAQTLPPGDMVITDNLGSHKRPGMREAIERAGAGLALCPVLRTLGLRRVSDPLEFHRAEIANGRVPSARA